MTAASFRASATTETVLTIGGQPHPGAAARYPVRNPARPAEIVGHAPAAARDQLDATVQAARRLTPVLLELGGNDAAIIAPDIFVTDQLVEQLVTATYTTCGQVCMAIKRLYVPGNRVDELADAVLARCQQDVIGDGLADDVTLGRAFTPPRAFVRHPAPHQLSGIDFGPYVTARVPKPAWGIAQHRRWVPG